MPNKQASNGENISNPEEQALKKRKIIKWVILLTIIAIFIVFIYFSCRPTSVAIDVTNITFSDNKMLITDQNNHVFTVNNYLNNTSSEIYYSANNKTAYIFYVATTEGKINFRVLDKDSINDGHYVFIGSMVPFKCEQTNTNLNNWYNSSISNHSFIPNESTPWWYYVLQFAPTIIFLILIFYMWKRMGSGGMGLGSGEESIFSMGKSQGKLVTSNVKFSDVAGINEEKEELIEIVDYLKQPAKYSAMGARTPKGVILYGPPGTGKTLLAKAVAGEAKVPFFQVSGSAFEDMLVGVGAKRVRDLFMKARKASPSIIFIDEIDSVASKRGKFDMSGGGGIADQTINQLLAEMDGFSTKTGVVVVAATNRIDTLDDAILRPGRFDRHIQVNLPDIKEREDILRIHSKNKNISSSVNFNDIARRTPGMSGAQLENVLNEATLLAVRFGKNVVGMKEIDEGIDRVIAGPAKKSRVMSEQEKRHIAVHEAGHAIVGLFTPGSDVVEKITIIPRGQAAGYTVSNPEKHEPVIQTKKELFNLVTELMGGRAAEEVQYGWDNISTGAANDLYRASSIVRSMVMQLGMTDVSMSQLIPSEGTNNPYQQKLYSDDTANKADAEVEKIIKERYANAKKIVSENKTELDLIVETLMILETIVKPQIDFIHKNKTLPPEAIKMKEENLKKLQEKKENIVNVNDTVVDLKNEQVKNEITIVKNSENSNFEKKTKKSSSKSKKNID